ncbi:hypothetical protein [Nonomuraea jabiensis]
MAPTDQQAAGHPFLKRMYDDVATAYGFADADVEELIAARDW